MLSGPGPGGPGHHPPHPLLWSQGHPGPQLQRLPQVTLPVRLFVSSSLLASSLLNQPVSDKARTVSVWVSCLLALRNEKCIRDMVLITNIH